ncbi:hypothetical protein ATANTOWER_010460 [Ataeniobius toweri]|uniref:Uncharacterized protein n=1 Tax=Ataeniobius toweri TaxID=208326 RepID=A0ABU7A8Z3_9TELE|nr:hypothetical protein [Ataeniobius toweri]
MAAQVLSRLVVKGPQQASPEDNPPPLSSPRCPLSVSTQLAAEVGCQHRCSCIPLFFSSMDRTPGPAASGSLLCPFDPQSGQMVGHTELSSGSGLSFETELLLCTVATCLVRKTINANHWGNPCIENFLPVHIQH